VNHSLGLDEFFKDYRNLNIQVRTGVSLVEEQMTGVRELMEEYLQKIDPAILVIDAWKRSSAQGH
jgi:hypothetical protein